MRRPSRSTEMIAARDPRLFIFYPLICLTHDPGILAESQPLPARRSPVVYACAALTRQLADWQSASAPLALLAQIARAGGALQCVIIAHPRRRQPCLYPLLSAPQTPQTPHPLPVP